MAIKHIHIRIYEQRTTNIEHNVIPLTVYINGNLNMRTNGMLTQIIIKSRIKFTILNNNA